MSLPFSHPKVEVLAAQAPVHVGVRGRADKGHGVPAGARGKQPAVRMRREVVAMFGSSSQSDPLL